MAAERKAVSSKLKLVISYNDENDNLCEKSVQMLNRPTSLRPSTLSVPCTKIRLRASMKSSKTKSRRKGRTSQSASLTAPL